MYLASPRRAECDSDSAIEHVARRAGGRGGGGRVVGGRLIDVSAGTGGAAGVAAGLDRRSGHWRSRL
jgi:hypothetical protein